MKWTENASAPGRGSGPVFVFPSHPDQLHIIQQVVQGIGPVPELVLFPQAFRHREEQELIYVRAGQGDVAAEACGDADRPSLKKPDKLQLIPSSSSFMQEGVSCSSSG